MTKKDSGLRSSLRIGAISILFLTMVGLVVFKTGMFHSASTDGGGLSGVVSVKGTVKAEDLNLSGSEVSKLNHAVEKHRNTFTKVDLFLDAKGDSGDISGKTVLVWAMVLETNGECEVRSWSRKIARGELVPQMVLYMNKAAKEYEHFQKFPDVKQNFKCLYI